MSMPKSALRHRPIHQDAIAPQVGVPPRARAAYPWRTDDQAGISLPVRTATGRAWAGNRPTGNGNVREDRTWSTRSGKKYAAPADVAVVEEEDEEPVPMTYTTTTSRPGTALAPRRTTTQQYPGRPTALPAPRTRGQVMTHKRPARRVHWLLPVGTGMVVMLLLYLAASWVHVWVVGLQDDWTYGTTRTYHLDAVVGHSDSVAHRTHFTALNLHGQVVIIEFPGGDLTHAKIYPGPHLPWRDAATSIIQLSARDVTGDGKPDLLISIQQEPTISSWNPPLTTLVMVNTGSSFKSPAQQTQ